MSFNPNIFTEKAQKVFASSISLCSENGHSQIMPVHICLALFDDDDKLATGILERAGANVGSVNSELKKLLAKLPSQSPPPSPSLSQATLKVLKDAEDIQKKQADSFVAVDHLLLAVANVKEIFQVFVASSILPVLVFAAFNKSSAPIFEVKIIIVLVKSTVFPVESVSLPSSKT
jgi:ATP-dependent Clp protease ATP-binding subunit ClpB